MAEPTSKEIQAAYDALEELYYGACALNLHGSHDSEEEWHSAILKVLPPKPRPTMAEIEWDDDEHYLAEAIHPVYETVLMLGPYMDGTIKFLTLNRADSKTVWGQPESLILTGRRYTLTEVQE